MEFNGNFVALPKAYADCTVTGQNGTASSRAGTQDPTFEHTPWSAQTHAADVAATFCSKSANVKIAGTLLSRMPYIGVYI